MNITKTLETLEILEKALIEMEHELELICERHLDFLARAVSAKTMVTMQEAKTIDGKYARRLKQIAKRLK